MTGDRHFDTTTGGKYADDLLPQSKASDAIGVRGIVVHAISVEARRFYLALGFEECQGKPMMLVVTLGDLRAGLGYGLGVRVDEKKAVAAVAADTPPGFVAEGREADSSAALRNDKNKTAE